MGLVAQHLGFVPNGLALEQMGYSETAMPQEKNLPSSASRFSEARGIPCRVGDRR